MNLYLLAVTTRHSTKPTMSVALDRVWLERRGRQEQGQQRRWKPSLCSLMREILVVGVRARSRG